ncbi:MAG TPA: pyridoxamine 5'-phosphate oxidase family protein [Chloroflexota bacterium]|nr:pyridoxamine 5'-phosphate oxidase family protein [Chloroflexota bacterium]
MTPASDVERPSDAAAARAEALTYLAAHNTVSLATVGADGVWATTVFYASRDFTLYFLSEPKTRHAQNVAANPSVAATINEDYRDWRQIKGIQMAGTCAEITGKRELAQALAAYVKKYPFVAQFLSPGQLLRGMQVAGRALDVRLYRIAPTRILYLDNERGFSNRREIPLEAK